MAAYLRRRRRWANFFGRRIDPTAATRLVLAPRRLETRRMLDAAAPGLAMEMLDLSSQFVQAGVDSAELASPVPLSSENASEGVNSPPANIQILPLSPIDENGVASLEMVFDDADPLDAHTVEVDWGDASVELFNVPSGSQFFGTTHKYLDDDPSVTPSDVYTVNVKVADAAGAMAEGLAPITVSNVEPSNLQIAPLAPIDENGIGSLELTFDDPGTLDTHTVEVAWGDGAVEVFNVPQGSRFFGTTHQYLDDDPSGTSADAYTVNIRVLDDDDGEVVGSAPITVSNIAPSNLHIDSLRMIDENGLAQLTLSFDDPGTLDAHTVQVDWGDGSVEQFNVPQGSRFFGTTHQYLDDDPSVTASDIYSVKVQLADDDLGETTGMADITVKNVAPSMLQIDPLAPIDENGFAVLNVAFSDPGTLDAHTVEIDWGDSSALETLAVAAGARTFAAAHQYLDDSPSGTSADSYAIKVKVRDDDDGMAMASTAITVNNVAPSVTLLPLTPSAAEGSLATVLFVGNDVGSQDTHNYEVDWGDGHLSAGAGNVALLTHTYADNGAYTVRAIITDDDSGEGSATTTITVGNASPELTVAGNQTVNEGSLLSITNIGTFTDPGFDNPSNTQDPSNGGETSETFTYLINWGDGTAIDSGAGNVDMPGAVGTPTSGSFDSSHTYADDGMYTVTVFVFDDDGGMHQGSFQVTVLNVAPTLTVVGNQTVNEGSQLSLVNIGTLTDPGFKNALNPGGATDETFTYTINWGDGTVADSGTATVDALGGVGAPTSGSFDGAHTYADNGVYSVTVTVFDDDGGQHQQTFQATVLNVAPMLSVVGNQAINEGSLLSITNIGAFTDPGFWNAFNPVSGGETAETFTFNINWGDGTADSTGVASIDVFGEPGVATAGSFDGSHTYADNGVYTVVVRVFDDDGGQHEGSFQFTVSNVAPTLTVVGSQTVNEGSLLSLTTIGAFTDPGFDNLLNAGNVSNGGETTETFTYTINWGDGTTNSAGPTTIDAPGAAGTPTAGSFDGQHTYADNGVYTVTVTVFDDDGGERQQTFEVTVLNVAPSLGPIAHRTINEGSLLSITNLGTLTDPGFNNPDNAIVGGELEETFTYTINWGDGTSTDAGEATVDLVGSPGVLTAASFAGAHTYADDALYTVTVTVLDDDDGHHVQTFLVTVNNVAPTLNLTVNQSLIEAIDEGGVTEVNVTGLFSDPGFDNPNNLALFPGREEPETEESFTYEVDWGDGHTSGPFSLTDSNGSAGVNSTGSIAQFFTHQYVDNDLDGIRDAKYTVTVTVYDDDNGVNSKTLEVIVYNTNPVLDPIAATEVNTLGQTTLTLTFDDLGAEGFETFEILIDWGDKLTVADRLARFVVESPHDGPTPQTFVFAHTYSGPPDPLHPADDIVISVKIRDDDFGTATSRPDADPLTIDGQSNIETVAITNPGLGGEPFRIDTTPQVAVLTFPDRPVVPAVITPQEARLATSTTADEGGGGGDSRAASERFLELRVINPDGTESEGYRLRSQVLNNLPALFRNLPDNHYAIYLVQSETNVRRLVIEVFVRNGKLIDPGDDSEGARDRPPTDERQTVPGEKLQLPKEAIPEEDAAADQSADAKRELPERAPSATALYHRTALAGVALALSGAGRHWRRDLDAEMVRAKPNQWKRLRTVGHRPRKPR